MQYDEPPALPPRSSDFLETDAPPLPHRSTEEEEEEDDDKGVYEELSEAAPPVSEGPKS